MNAWAERDLGQHDRSDQDNRRRHQRPPLLVPDQPGDKDEGEWFAIGQEAEPRARRHPTVLASGTPGHGGGQHQ